MKKEWKIVRLGDYISIRSGLAYKGNKIGKGNALLLGMGCVSFKDKFIDAGVRPYDDEEIDESFCVVPGDIVLATRQQSDNLPILAMPAIIPKTLQEKKIIFGTNLYKVDNNSEISNRFLFWLLKHQHYVDYIAGVKSGTAVQMVTKKNVENYKFMCPPKEQREKIADILWDYDDLIELNNKHIKILEQTAKEIYKEWFVRFRFPGYEKSEFEKGIPKTWNNKKLRDIAEECGKNEKKENRVAYKYYLPIDCIDGEKMSLSNVDCIENAESSLVAFQKGDILFGAMRPYFHKVILAPFTGLSRKTCLIIKPIKKEYRNFLYLSLFQKSSVDYATTVSIGSTMPYVRWSDLRRMDIIEPDETIIKKFNKIVNPILEELMKYFYINKNIIRQRDLLLPRLMSGKLEVK